MCHLSHVMVAHTLPCISLWIKASAKLLNVNVMVSPSQYSLAVKTEAIRKLKRDSEQAQRQMQQAERDLEEDAVAFEEFLKINDQNSVDAVKLSVFRLLFLHAITPFQVTIFFSFFQNYNLCFLGQRGKLWLNWRKQQRLKKSCQK